MRIGIVILIFGYVLSQFYRAFLAVLTPALEAEIGATPDDLASASGFWFLTFALMQIPVGYALDRIGPRLTSSALLVVAGIGALVFSWSTVPLHITIAMSLIGIGCSSVLMSAYYIFARVYPAAIFATLAASTIGIGSIGNIASSYPLTWLIGEIGWREAMVWIAGVTFVVAALLAIVIRNPATAEGERGSFLDLLRIRALWLIYPIMLFSYAPVAGLRGLWIGPYLSEVFGASTDMLGLATLIMGIAMIIGSFAYGPIDRLLGTRKWVVAAGSVLVVVALSALALLPGQSLALAVTLLTLVGFFGVGFPMIVAHGRAFIPQNLTGRGVTLLNLFGIGGAGLMQMVSSRVFDTVERSSADPTAPYVAIFMVFGLTTLAGVLVYLKSTDRLD